MATLRNRLELEDAMTPVLNRVRGTLGRVALGCVNTAITANRSFNTMKNSAHSAMAQIAEGATNVSVNVGAALASDKPFTNMAALGRSSMSQLSESLRGTAVNAGKYFSNMRGNVQSSLTSLSSSFGDMTLNAGSALDKVGRHADKLSDKLIGIGRGLRGVSAETDGVKTAISSMGGLINSTIGKFTIAGIATNAISSLVSKVSELPGKLQSVATGYAGIEARLKLLTGSQEKVAEMNKLIYESALRSRGSFESMADAVTKIGMTAKEAFPDPKEIIPFMEGIQKLFVIGGTNKTNQGAAMLQLTQALGSGKLQGDEFRSIAENAPLIEKMVAKTLGVTQGELKQLASEGAVTAEVVKKAILENMDEINSQFEVMPMTFEQHMQRLETIAYDAFTPVMKIINDLWKSNGVTAATNLIADGIKRLANEVEYVLNGIINNVKWVSGQIKSHWAVIEPLVMGLGLAFLALGAKAVLGGLMTVAGYAMAGAAIVAHAIASAIDTLAIIGLTLAQDGLTAAMAAFNTVMLANPITWFVGLIVLLVAVFYGAIAVINRFAGTSISATGLIFGAFAWLATHLVNLVKFIANAFIGFANMLGVIFADPLNIVYNFFATIWNGIISLVEEAVNHIIDLVNDIPGMDKIGKKFDHISGASLTLEKREVAEAAWHLDGFEYGDAAYNAREAYDFADNFSIGDWLQPSMGDNGGTDIEDIKSGQGGLDSQDSDNLGDVAGNTGTTADNTGRIADSLDILEDEVKELREFANQEMVNYYTNKEYTVTVGDINNSISRPADVDGVITQVTTYLREGMNSGAEFVHA